MSMLALWHLTKVRSRKRQMKKLYQIIINLYLVGALLSED